MRSAYFSALCLVLILLSCGDFDDESAFEVLESAAGEIPAKVNASNPAAPGTQSGGEMCLSDCDSDSWKYLTSEELSLPEFAVSERCRIASTSAFPRVPNIELLTSVTCAGVSKLYLLSINAAGILVQQPVQIVQCPLNQNFFNVRRETGDSGVVTMFSCGLTSSRSVRLDVRFENLSGIEIYRNTLMSSYSWEGRAELGYLAGADVWAVVYNGLFIRMNRFRIMSGPTYLANASNSGGVLVRSGLFQIVHNAGNTVCNRVSAAGAFHCSNNIHLPGAGSVAPIRNSNLVLVQDGVNLMLGTDSAGQATMTRTSSIPARHGREFTLRSALAVKDTPYAVSLGAYRGDFLLSVFQNSPTFEHLTSLPLGPVSDCFSLFSLGERIYATWVENETAKTVSIPTAVVQQ